MKSKKRILCQIVFVVAAITAWILALVTSNKLISTYQGVSVRFKNAAMTKAMIERTNPEGTGDQLRVQAAWERVPEKKTMTSELNSSVSVHKIIAYGDVFATEELKVISGSILLDDDRNGCLIDKETAWLLLRTTDAVGAKISLEGKDYTIRGVVQSFDRIVIIRDDEERYSNIEFSPDNLSTAKQEISTFLLKSGCNEEYLLIENGLFAKMIYSFVWSSAELFMIIVAAQMIQRALQNRLQQEVDVIYLVAGVLLAVASIAMISRTFFWPQTFLPSRWSDFAFYGKLLSEWSKQIDAIALATPLPREIEFFRTVRLVAILNTFTIVVGFSLLVFSTPGNQISRKDHGIAESCIENSI